MKTTTSVKCSLQLNGERTILFAGKSYEPDQCTAYFDMYLSHAFPVVTKDRFAIHPQVVANSYHTMERKMLNLAHQIQSYDPDEPEDRILGSIVAVEFPGRLRVEGGNGLSDGGSPDPQPSTLNSQPFKVQGDKNKAPGIHALCSLWKSAKGAMDILAEHLTGKHDWTVSQEVFFNYDECGWVLGKKGLRVEGVNGLSDEAFRLLVPQLSTLNPQPDDLAALGYTYVPMAKASEALLACYDFESGRMRYPWSEREVILMVGGLDGQVHYGGAGLCMYGKEKEARVGRMVASSGRLSVEGKNGLSDGGRFGPSTLNSNPGQVVAVLARVLRMAGK